MVQILGLLNALSVAHDCLYTKLVQFCYPQNLTFIHNEKSGTRLLERLIPHTSEHANYCV